MKRLLLTLSFLILSALQSFALSDVTLAWTPSTSSGVTGQHLLYSNSAPSSAGRFGGPVVINLAPGVTQYTIHGLADGNYWFAVTAYALGGESVYSNVVASVLAAPAAPTNIHVVN